MPDAPIIIAPMRSEDIPEVVAIEGLSFPSHWQPGAYETELMNAKSHYFVARQQARVAGFAGMWVTDEEAHIATLAVHLDLRRRGIGQRLLRALLFRAHDLRVERVTLEVRAANQAAICLYEKHAFARVAYLQRYYADTGEDGIIMWLKPLVLPDDGRGTRLVVLKSVHDTMHAESLLKQAGIAHRIIPKPVSIAADCGLAITFEERREPALMGLLQQNGLHASVLAAVNL